MEDLCYKYTRQTRTVVLCPAVSTNDSLRTAFSVLHLNLNVLEDSIRIDVHRLYLVYGGHDCVRSCLLAFGLIGENARQKLKKLYIRVHIHSQMFSAPVVLLVSLLIASGQ